MLNAAQPIPHQRFASASDCPLSDLASAPGPDGQLDQPDFICVSAALRRLLLQAEITGSHLRLASLEGEAGTGKHLLAHTIHARSSLARLPFNRRDAREWLANEADTATFSGTLYLDRVDLLAPIGQNLFLNLIKLLQNLESSQNPPQFLLLVSAHTSLRLLASQGAFLPDLAFRLTAVRFAMPPLREHREDIVPITQALIDRVCRRYRQPTPVLAPGSLPRLLQHSWPGNVRELAAVIESAILESNNGALRPIDLQLQQTSPQQPPLSGPAAARIPDDLTLDSVVHHHIQMVLELNRGNKLRAARQLGISRSTLYRFLDGQNSLAG